MICSNCNNETSDDSLFCGKCGNEMPKKISPTPDENLNSIPNTNPSNINKPIEEEVNAETTQSTSTNSIQSNTLKNSTSNIVFTPQNSENNIVPNPAQLKSHSKKKNFIIIGSIISAIVLLIIIVAITVITPVNKFLDYIDKNNYSAAEAIYYEKIYNNTSYKNEVKNQLNEKINNIELDYKNESLSYDDATLKLRKIEKIDYIETDASTVLEKVNDIETSRTAFKDGESALEKKDYFTAISKFNEVIADDPNYSTAQSKISDNKENYLNNLFSNCDKNMESKKYTDVIEDLDNGLKLFKSDKNTKTKISLYKDEKMKIIKSNQLISIESAKVFEQDPVYKSLYPDMLQAIVKNNSDKQIKSLVINFVGYDKNGKSVKLKTPTGIESSYFYTGLVNDISIPAGGTFGSDAGFEIAANHGVVKVEACISTATFTDGSRWRNEYFKTWEEEHTPN